MKKIIPKIISNKLIDKNFYKILFGPFYKIYSFNFASILRNIFFTGVKGYGISEVKFFGADSEFDYIPGVRDDVLNLILNLKGIIFNVKHKKKKIILSLNKKGPCVIKASDFYLNNFVTILNPNHIITNLSPNFYLNLNIKLERGMGFFSLNNNNYKKNKDLNGILLDVNFCPVLDAYYNIIDIDTSDDLVNIEFLIKTNGTLSAKNILIKSIKILNKLTDVNFKKKINKYIFTKISDLKFDNKYLSYFKKLNVKSLGDLIFLNDKKILKYSNLDFDFLKLIKSTLFKYNLHLNTKLKKI